MSNRGNTKKRRMGSGGDDGGGDSGGSSELAAIKSMMQELVQQNNTQTNMINNMQAEIIQLSKKCMSQVCNVKLHSYQRSVIRWRQQLRV